MKDKYRLGCPGQLDNQKNSTPHFCDLCFCIIEFSKCGIPFYVELVTVNAIEGILRLK